MASPRTHSRPSSIPPPDIMDKFTMGPEEIQLLESKDASSENYINHRLLDEVDIQLREERENVKRGKHEPHEASNEAAFDRGVLPHLSPIDSTCPTPHMTIDTARNVFLFVNPTSGGNAAAAFMEAGLEHIRMTCPETVNLWIWDIRQGSSGKKPGFVKLKRTVEGLNILLQQEKEKQQDSVGVKNSIVYVVVAGGDGTVMWCLTEIWAHGIDDERIALGVVPYGTGNDFARALGWQKYNAAKPYQNKFKVLKQLVKDWFSANIVLHDIWEVMLIAQGEGGFQKIDSRTRKKKNVDGIRPMLNQRILSKTISVMEALGEAPPQIEARVLCLKMCNYFSVGIESRIGIGFDRYRTKSQFCNKVRYGVEGGKKAFFKSTSKISDVAEVLVELDSSGTESILFDTTVASSNFHLSRSTMSLIASNIPSFAAGLDLWGTTSKVGLLSGKTLVQDPDLKSHKQKMGDGVLEFVSFTGAMALGLERAFHGQGKRVCLGKGPFELKFKELALEASSKPNRDGKVYFQVDGEFFIMTRPKSIAINFKRRIKVLASPHIGLDNFILAK